MRSIFIVIALILAIQFNFSFQQQLTQQQKDLMNQYQNQLQTAIKNLSSSSGGQINVSYTGTGTPTYNTSQLQLTPEQQQQFEQSMQLSQQMFSSFSNMSFGSNMTGDHSTTQQMDEQQMEQLFANFQNLGIPVGQHGLNPEELDASDFNNKQQFEEIMNNLTKTVKQLGLETNQTKLNAMRAEMEKAYNAQIQAQFNQSQVAQENFRSQMYGSNSPPPQFQNMQNLLSQYQKSGDTQGLQEVEFRMQNAQQQQLKLQGMQAQMQANMQNFQQQMQNIGQQGNPQSFINAMKQFGEDNGQLTGENFRQVAQKLQQSDMFGNVTNTDDAKNMLYYLAKMAKNQGNVDILAQTNSNDTEGVEQAQKAIDQMRLDGQKKFAYLMSQGGDTSQFLSDANMFFQKFQPGSASSEMSVTAGQDQPKMTLPPGFMQNALKGLSNVVAQISQVDPGEWDSIDDIAQFALSKIVDIKFFSNDSQVDISGLSSSEKITFCAPLEDTSATTCAGFKCGYIDPNSQTLKYDGVSLVSDSIKYLADGVTVCCECEAAHATSFAVVSSSANAGKLMLSLLGLLLAILALFFA